MAVLERYFNKEACTVLQSCGHNGNSNGRQNHIEPPEISHLCHEKILWYYFMQYLERFISFHIHASEISDSFMYSSNHRMILSTDPCAKSTYCSWQADPTGADPTYVVLVLRSLSFRS